MPFNQCHQRKSTAQGHRTRVPHTGTAQQHHTRAPHNGTIQGHRIRVLHRGIAHGHRTRAPNKGNAQYKRTAQVYRKGTTRVSQKGTAQGYRTKRQRTKVRILHKGIAGQKYHAPPHRRAPRIINRRNVLEPRIRRHCRPGKQCRRRSHLPGVTFLSHIATSGNSKQ